MLRSDNGPPYCGVPMTSVQHAQALDELAEALGVTRGYHDGTGQWRRACDEAVVAVARALGAPLERIEDAPEALRCIREQKSGPSAPGVAVFTSGAGGHVTVPCPQAASVRARLVLESGEAMDVTVEQSTAISLRVNLPRDTATGYHQLEVEDGSHLTRVHVLVAPPRLPPAPRGWGLFAPLYSLRTDRREGAGLATYSDLPRLAQWMVDASPSSGGRRDAAYLGTLPLLACFFEEPFEPSPYSPISRAFWSEIYIDPLAAPEFDAGDVMLAASTTGGLAGHPTDRPMDRLADHPMDRLADHQMDRRMDRIDYRRAMHERRVAIEALLRSLDARGGRRRDEFENALEDDEELARYAAFRACVERQGRTWPGWPVRAREGTLRPGSDYDGEAFRYHAYAQWLAREQVGAAAAASPAGLYLDLPLGSHGGGYDTWRHGGDFAAGVSAGAPPDAVFEGGQDWGFPPLHPERARAHCYASVRAALAHHFEHAALLRVDHVMGLHRLFWIPDGFTAADGVYVRSRADELWSVLAIEAARARGGAGAAVVGEDLGTVPEEVRAEMNSRGALRMFVVPFECRDEAASPLAEPRSDALACLGTHDMEPFASWWDQPTTRQREIAAFLGCDEQSSTAADVLAALLAWMSAGDATIVFANLEDFWLERERQNLPGTEAAERNWKRPFAHTFADFAGDAQIRELVRIVRGAAVQEAPSQTSAGGSA